MRIDFRSPRAEVGRSVKRLPIIQVKFDNSKLEVVAMGKKNLHSVYILKAEPT